MVPRTSYPPTHHHPHLTQPIPPSIAQEHLSTYLLQSQNHAYLHPDSQLSRQKIDFSAHAGPNGGLAIHHLRRIEAGLRGENLRGETQEELKRFDSSIADDDEVEGAELPEGDDSKLDSLIARKDPTPTATPKGKGKRKRTPAEIEEWAESSSQADFPVGQQELESFANTPLHRPYYHSNAPNGDHYDDDDTYWRDPETHAQEQDEWFGDVGEDERQGAPVVKQNGSVPEVAGGRGMSEAEKKAKRKEQKKARRKEEKRAMAAAKEKAKGKGGEG